MRFSSRLMCVVVAGLTLIGCGATGKFVYPADGRTLLRATTDPAYPKQVAVPPFRDLRGSDNESGTMLLYLIPLFPYGFSTYERPDAAEPFLTLRDFDFDASEDLAKAAALSLRESGLFKDAYFTFGADKEKADFVLYGEILSTNYSGAMWSYGLSIFGPLLWIFGVPIGRSTNELILKFRLEDRASAGVIWEGTFERKAKQLQGFYYYMGHDVRNYAILMQDIMNTAVAEMAQAMRQRESQ